jgi:hypothetical protein
MDKNREAQLYENQDQGLSRRKPNIGQTNHNLTKGMNLDRKEKPGSDDSEKFEIKEPDLNVVHPITGEYTLLGGKRRKTYKKKYHKKKSHKKRHLRKSKKTKKH